MLDFLSVCKVLHKVNVKLIKYLHVWVDKGNQYLKLYLNCFLFCDTHMWTKRFFNSPVCEKDVGQVAGIFLYKSFIVKTHF